MLAIFGKKKLTDNQVANVFVNTLIESVEAGWPLVSGFIKDCPEFTTTPQIEEDDYGKFLMIVIAANFAYIPENFENGHDREIIRRCVEKFANMFDLEPEQFAAKVKDYKKFLNRVNMPSKNMLYAMSKAVFFKYELNQYQENYFKSLNTPNPIFLKNLDDVMRNFLWDMEAFQEKYKVKDEAIAS